MTSDECTGAGTSHVSYLADRPEAEKWAQLMALPLVDSVDHLATPASGFFFQRRQQIMQVPARTD